MSRSLNVTSRSPLLFLHPSPVPFLPHPFSLPCHSLQWCLATRWSSPCHWLLSHTFPLSLSPQVLFPLFPGFCLNLSSSILEQEFKRQELSRKLLQIAYQILCHDKIFKKMYTYARSSQQGTYSWIQVEQCSKVSIPSPISARFYPCPCNYDHPPFFKFHSFLLNSLPVLAKAARQVRSYDL